MKTFAFTSTRGPGEVSIPAHWPDDVAPYIAAWQKGFKPGDAFQFVTFDGRLVLSVLGGNV